METLFAGWQETLIWSCLQGVMGSIYASGVDSAMALIGDFCFLAGEPDEELLHFRPNGYENRYLILVPQNEAWSRLIEETYDETMRRTERYAIRKEPDVFDRVHLKEAVKALPEGCTLHRIDEKWYQECLRHDWSRDLVSTYRDYEEYQKLGHGIVAEDQGELVAGASSYTSYQEGIEIEIDTRQDHRRKGLAYACGAQLILDCMDRGLYPSWDAHNMGSVALAEKLGYHFDHAYPVYVPK